MSREEIIDKLRDDEHYYGEFGQQYMSNSDIAALFNNPREFKKRDEGLHPSYLVGGYFHTAILEPHKLSNYKIMDVNSRISKAYKELDGHALLRKEVDNIELMKKALEACDETRNLVYPVLDKKAIEYEVPSIGTIFDVDFKGKADILNHDEKLIVDLKTTGDILNFRKSAYKYNYDSQAYIYRKLFNYDLIFIAIDKKTHQVGIFECEESFYDRGEMKVETAVEVYRQWTDKNFDPDQAFIYDKLN